ncbi:sulfotransferase domain-containing protein [Oscillatoria salina]|uniref:sulfotransferase domain-containing protein n=1 Tax=Oscillatoria salina TaxID=331517 RepID=UPI0013B78EC6|nr:sulfotransferase domain-containing protein [Oscillatoria salina]MBZ8179763.1 sulfotransferase domain-containing protein [Oscillatoria salina IIICB1]NET87726.1 sulfotransferase domain-containing protein [Kamptonema sp. SIO1D9]
MNKPDFFLVGAAKCGTTSMYKYLRQHPEIFMPQDKEPHFFGCDLNYSSLSIKNEQEYLALFSEAKNGQRIGEASVWYLYSEKAAEEIKNFCPSAQIIIMLRNPVDMLYSLYNYFIATGRENIADFGSALAAEKERKQGLRLPKTLYSFPQELLYYREIAKYTKQCQAYLDCFGKDNIHWIIFDDLLIEPEIVYKKTLKFLRVNEEFQVPFTQENKAKIRISRSKKIQKLLKNPLSIWLVRKMMPRPNQGKLFRLIKAWDKINNKYTTPPAMNKEIRKNLQKEFAPEVERLSELLGRDLTHWSKDTN